MTTRTLKVLSRDPAGVTFADPSDRDLTVRFKNSSTSKSLRGVPVANHACEIIVNDGPTVMVGDVAVKDALSIRLRTSCAAASASRLRQLLLSLAAQVGQWETEGVFTGFPAETAPVIITA